MALVFFSKICVNSNTVIVCISVNMFNKHTYYGLEVFPSIAYDISAIIS